MRPLFWLLRWMPQLAGVCLILAVLFGGFGVLLAAPKEVSFTCPDTTVGQCFTTMEKAFAIDVVYSGKFVNNKITLSFTGTEPVKAIKAIFDAAGISGFSVQLAADGKKLVVAVLGDTDAANPNTGFPPFPPVSGAAAAPAATDGTVPSPAGETVPVSSNFPNIPSAEELAKIKAKNASVAAKMEDEPILMPGGKDDSGVTMRQLRAVQEKAAVSAEDHNAPLPIGSGSDGVVTQGELRKRQKEGVARLNSDKTVTMPDGSKVNVEQLNKTSPGR